MQRESGLGQHSQLAAVVRGFTQEEGALVHDGLATCAPSIDLRIFPV